MFRQNPSTPSLFLIVPRHLFPVFVPPVAVPKLHMIRSLRQKRHPGKDPHADEEGEEGTLLPCQQAVHERLRSITLRVAGSCF